MKENRRKYPRVNHHFTVRYKIEGPEGIADRVVFLKNISRGGMLFTSDLEFKVGVTIEWEIDLPERGRVPMSGKVVRCHEIPKPGEIKIYNVAVEFMGFMIHRETFDCIEKLVDEERPA